MRSVSLRRGRVQKGNRFYVRPPPVGRTTCILRVKRGGGGHRKEVPRARAGRASASQWKATTAIRSNKKLQAACQPVPRSKQKSRKNYWLPGSQPLQQNQKNTNTPLPNETAINMSSDWSSKQHPDVIALFDVDGTLTPARKVISPEMKQVLAALRKKIVIGFVGGSDLVKQKEQIGEDAVDLFDFSFSENGLTAFRLGKPLPSASFIGYLGEERYARLANFVLKYIANLELPKKRGTFIEFRNGMINVSPIGRNCSHPERDEFEAYDKVHQVRAKFIEALKKEFPDYDLIYSIGGQISFDVMPRGWDKTYCLRHLQNENFKTIHFFGDKTFKGGNDFEIFTHPSVTGHTVTEPADTARILKELFGI
ncbi:eukaryotic phosphomannomutase-domain-containing protein [Zopfochytrium polystomum]|nr:eukaryotic phosphomannomutase-domain-containing protein [Zopfochytrium polystomum]